MKAKRLFYLLRQVVLAASVLVVLAVAVNFEAPVLDRSCVSGVEARHYLVFCVPLLLLKGAGASPPHRQLVLRSTRRATHVAFRCVAENALRNGLTLASHVWLRRLLLSFSTSALQKLLGRYVCWATQSLNFEKALTELVLSELVDGRVVLSQTVQGLAGQRPMLDVCNACSQVGCP